jgi:hypothetical protein
MTTNNNEPRDDAGRWTGSTITPENNLKMKRIAQLHAERMAEARGERVAGAPARLFRDIARQGASVVMRGIKKGIPGAPSLVHTPGPNQLALGGKKRRKYLHRAGLFQKDLGVNGVHADAEVKVRKKPVLSLADTYALKYGNNPAIGSTISKLNYSIARRLAIAKAGDPYHDEGGHFTSADAAVDPQGSRENRKPQQATGPGLGYATTRAVSSGAGWLGGNVAGAGIGEGIGTGLALASAPFIGPAAAALPWIGAGVGGFLGGMAGDRVASGIAGKVWSMATGDKEPTDTVGESLSRDVLSTVGYYAAGPLGAALEGVGAPAADAVARVVGMSAGDLAGTRFGGYVQDKVGGTVKELAGNIFSATDAADELRDAADFSKRDKMVSFPPRRLSNDVNDALRLKEAPAASRFRNVLLSMDAEGRAKAAALASYRPEAQTVLRPRPGEPYQVFHQRIVRTVAEQQAPSFLPGGSQRAPTLFPKGNSSRST